ncbi:MAG: tyrosine--tRNA ligase [Burkholderiales bacterium]|nr:tyrosine--tRNA ligase [Burkholderiales bacterium]
MNALDTLQERGFVAQVTDHNSLRERLGAGPITYYIGFDPTAASLHCGSLVPLMAMAHLQRAGHRPVGLVGGGTALVGDPSGKTEMRQMLSPEAIAANGEGILAQIRRYLDLEAPAGMAANNADWLTGLKYIEFLRDIGRHFRVNEMIRAEAYRARLEREEGLSFIEFNYQLLQAYDYLMLYERHGCLLQMGGDDQWSNILAGCDLIRRRHAAQAYCVTFPLLTTARGEKMGKSAGGAVWLDAERTSPYDFFQYWVNTDDRDVRRFLALFTFLPMDEVERLGAAVGADLNASKRILAYEVTRLAHGEAAANAARDAAAAAFGGGGDVSAIPSTRIDLARLTAGIALVELLVEAGLAPSKGEARRLIQQGGAYVNDHAAGDVQARVGPADLRDGAVILRAGKKKIHRVLV